MSEKIYIPKSRAKERETPFGKVLNVSFDAKELIAFVQSHTNSRGYFNITLAPRRNPDETQTHSVAWDSWEPTNAKPLDGARKAVESAPATPPATGDESDSVPF